MGAAMCFFDSAACDRMGDCLSCDRFPGEDKAKEMVAKERTKDRDALVKARDVTQLDPAQFAARVVTQWDEAVYGFGSTPDKAMTDAEARFVERYDFAVRYYDFMKQ